MKAAEALLFTTQRIRSLSEKLPQNAAFFVSPLGRIFPVDVHILEIIRDPESFGLSKEAIQAIYDKHNEKLGAEGNAREEIIVALVKRGWIRVRRYGNRGWSLNVARLDRSTKERITSWASAMLKGTKAGFKETDRYAEVRVDHPLGIEVHTIGQIAEYVLFRGDESAPKAVAPLMFIEGSCQIPRNEVVPVDILYLADGPVLR